MGVVCQLYDRSSVAAFNLTHLVKFTGEGHHEKAQLIHDSHYQGDEQEVFVARYRRTHDLSRLVQAIREDVLRTDVHILVRMPIFPSTTPCRAGTNQRLGVAGNTSKQSATISLLIV